MEEDLTGRVDALVDGGDCAVGVESTVITLAEGVPKVLRPGGVTVAQLREERGLTETPAWTISYYPPSGQVGLIEFVMGQPPAEENAENLE